MKLTADWKIEADRVTVQVRFSHAGPKPVYLILGEFRAAPENAVLWLNRLRVGFQAPETALLKSALIPLNPLATPVAPPTAFATKVDPNVPFQVELAAKLPLLPDDLPPVVSLSLGEKVVSPFPGGAPGIPDHPVTCKRLIFELGVIPHDDALKPEPMELAGRPVVRLAAAAWNLQKILTADRSGVSVPMLVVKGMERPAK